VCAQYSRPAGVTFCFQICEYSIEPAVPNRACNLLAKDPDRSLSPNKSKEVWPQIAIIRVAETLSSKAVGLAGTRPGPYRFGPAPPGEIKGKAPPPDPGEEMTLVKSGKVV
jgi:hypothetical protein